MGWLDHTDETDHMADELLAVWAILHDLVEATRNTAEHNHPKVFRTYDEACEQYGEVSRQATLPRAAHE